MRVKQLEWKQIDDDHWTATAMGLSYEIRQSIATGKIRVRSLSDNALKSFEDFGGTMDEAKALFQADFTRRALECWDMGEPVAQIKFGVSKPDGRTYDIIFSKEPLPGYAALYTIKGEDA